MQSKTHDQCENLEKINKDAKDIQEQIESIDIQDREKKVAKQGWQSKRNNTARQFVRQHDTLRELNNGLQQKVKEDVQFIDKLEHQLHEAEQRQKQLEQEEGQLDATFKSIEDRYSASYNAFAQKLLEKM